jgi:hypothetical protein
MMEPGHKLHRRAWVKKLSRAQFSELGGEKFELTSFPDKMNWRLLARRDGRVAEGARLESVYTFTGIGGSNPSLSARFLRDFDSMA